MGRRIGPVLLQKNVVGWYSSPLHDALESTLESLNNFRLAVARYTLLLSLACAAGAWPLDPNIARGVLLGGFAGTLGFWITARIVGVLTTPGGEGLEAYAVKWSLVRLLCYGAAISFAYTLDRAHYHGLIAAVFGILLVQVVMVGRAFVGRAGGDKK